jgi:Bifunctional DNA primase/polymerase, N-terminal
MMKINPNKNWTRIDFLKMYSMAGAFLFPFNKKTKKPAIKNNLKDASNDFDQLLRWEEQFDSPNWGISLAKSGWFGVDVDKAHGGLEKWATLIATYGEPKTLHAESGGSGKHFVFRAQEGVKYKGKIDKGIDIKHNGYIVVQPSIHPKGGVYLWHSEIFDVQPPPNWLHEIIVKKYPKAKGRY